MFLPPDTLDHWWSVKETLQDQRNVNGIFRGKCEEEARKARTIILAQDSTIQADSTLLANKTGLLDDCTRQYKELDRRTVPKSAIPWYVLLGLAVGALLARQ